MKNNRSKVLAKVFCLILVVALATSCLLVFASCNKIFAKDVSNTDEFYKATKGSLNRYTFTPSSNDINITSDFTIRTGDDFFAVQMASKTHLKDGTTLVKGLMLEKMTLNGNGHTITIKGDSNGSLGKSNMFLWRIQSCTIKDLNIVYDLDLSISGSDGSRFGGLAGQAFDSTIENCTVTYNRNTDISFWTDSYGFHNSRFGGLVGSVTNTTINNCKVNGKLLGTAGYFGGIVGTVTSDSVIKNSQFNGSLETKSMEECFAGCLAGYVDGTIVSCKATVDYLKFVGKPQASRSRTSSCGGLVGKLAGKLTDCYLDFNENGYLYAESIAKGVFSTTVQAGAIVGETVAGAVVKNIYVDGSFDNVANVQFAEKKRDVKLGIFANESTSVSNIFFVDDNYYYDYEETFTATREETESGYKFYGTIHGEDVVVEVVCKSSTDEDTGVTTWDKTVTRSITLTLGEESFYIDHTNILVDSIYYGDTFDNYNYGVTLDTTDQITYQVKVERELRHVSNGKVAFVTTYGDIDFELGENIIGGVENYWKIDSTTGKPLLKNID